MNVYVIGRSFLFILILHNLYSFKIIKNKNKLLKWSVSCGYPTRAHTHTRENSVAHAWMLHEFETKRERSGRFIYDIIKKCVHLTFLNVHASRFNLVQDPYMSNWISSGTGMGTDGIPITDNIPETTKKHNRQYNR